MGCLVAATAGPGWAAEATDEVEVYGTADLKTSLALRKRADQSRASQWSRGAPDFRPNPGEIACSQ